MVERKPTPAKWQPLMPRVWAKVKIDPDTGCWLWTAYTQPKGYAVIHWEGKSWLLHRAVYTFCVGPIPEGHELDHTCERKACCNPAHLEPVTTEVNSKRSPNTLAARNAAKTECPQGHPYDEENTRWSWLPGRRQKRLVRFCRACAREHDRRSSARGRARKLAEQGQQQMGESA
jgi:hypothetical protein